MNNKKTVLFCLGMGGMVLAALAGVTKMNIAQGSGETETYNHYRTVGDYWGGEGTQGTSIPNSQIWNATSVTGLGGDGNADWGAVVGTWGASISVSEGQSAEIVYKIGQESELITNATLNAEFKFWNANSDALHNGDRIFVDISSDGVNYQRVKHYGHITEDGVTTWNDTTAMDIEVDFADYIQASDNKQYFYVKLTMMHYIAYTEELGNWGMFIHNSYVSYGSEDSYIIHYDTKGGTLPSGTLYGLAVYDNTVYTLPTPSRDGYTFLGWFDGNDNPITTFDITRGEDLYITAKWELINTFHEITYENLCGATNDNPQTYDSTSTEIITLNPLSRSGYTFLGWYLGDQRVETLNPQTLSGDITLRAEWKENSYDVSYTVGDYCTLSCVGHTDLPLEIKTTDVFTYSVQCTSEHHLAFVRINGNNVKTEDIVENTFTVSGSDLVNKSIEVGAYAFGNVLGDRLDCNFNSYKYGDYSWINYTYTADNGRIVSDSPNNSGLSLASDGCVTLVYKFQARSGYQFSEIETDGTARLFDFNNGQYVSTNLKLYISTDGDDYSLIKQFSANNLTNGEEMVSLSFFKMFTENTKTLFVKVELNGSAYTDWAVLKSFSAVLTEEKGGSEDTSSSIDDSSIVEESSEHEEVSSEPAPVSSEEDPVSSEPTPVSNSDVSISSENSQVSSQSSDPSEGNGGCGGSIAAVSGLVTFISLLGVAIIAKKKHN